MKLASFFKLGLKTGGNRSLNIKKNILITFVFKGGSLAVNLLLVPITINFVSPPEYGVWLTLSSIITWFGISDIGLGNGLRNKFAEAVAQNNVKQAKGYVSTAYISLSGIVFLIWIVFFVLNFFLDWALILNTTTSSKELSKVVLILFTFFSFQFVLKLISTVLIANQEPGKASSFDFIANLIILGCIYLILKLNIDGSLISLAIITGSVQIIVYLAASLFFYLGYLKPYRPSFKFFNKKYVRSLISLGVKFFVIQIASILVFQSTNIIIAQLFGSEQVTVYNVAFRYYNIPVTIAIILTTPLWSAFTDAYVKGDYNWMRSVKIKVNYLILVISLMLIITLLVSPFIYRIWIGDKVYIPTEVSIAMMINMIATNLFNVNVVLINGIGKIKLQLLVYVICSLFFIPLAIFMGKSWGLTGIIYSNFIVYLLFAVILSVQCKKLIKQEAKGIWNK